MVLKYMEMSSGDCFSIQENRCLLLKALDFFDGYLGLDNENVYTYSHSFVNPLVILLSFFLYKNYSFSVPDL